jgi:hypothetical protein
MDKNDIVIVTSHADNIEKLYLLKKSIAELVKQKRTILLSSHLPVPDEILNMVDYYIYDRDNDLILPTEQPPIIYWINFGKYEQTYVFNTTHIYAALKLLMNALSFASSNGFKNGHVVVYDNILTDRSVIDNNIELLNENDLILYKEKGEYKSNLFSFRCQEFYQSIKHLDSKQKYLDMDARTFENLLSQLHTDLKTHFIDLDTIKSDNVIDAVCANGLHNHIIKDKDENITYLFLSKEQEEEQVYLFAMTFCDELNLQIKVNRKKYKLPLKVGEIKLLKLSNDIDISIHINEYGTDHIFDSETKICDCKINDKELIIDIEDLEII